MNNFGLLMLRVTAGLMMLLGHGWGKLTNFATIAPNFPDPIGLGSQISLSLAVFSEVFCAAALILGLFTRIVSVPLLITMLVAAFIIHDQDPWAKKEFALLYAVPFLTLIFTGGGKLSIDRFIKK